MTDNEVAYLRTVYDAVLWLAEELRRPGSDRVNRWHL
jgi:hypothetical protein